VTGIVAPRAAAAESMDRGVSWPPSDLGRVPETHSKITSQTQLNPVSIDCKSSELHKQGPKYLANVNIVLLSYSKGGSTKGWVVQCFTSPPTQYRLYGRRFLQVKRPNQQYQSTESTYSTQKNQTYNNQTINTKHSKSPSLH